MFTPKHHEDTSFVRPYWQQKLLDAFADKHEQYIVIPRKNGYSYIQEEWAKVGELLEEGTKGE